MKFPCPECGKSLEPDGEWGYCPYCGSLLEHASTVASFRWAGTFATLGEASIAADEMERRGIPSRIREQTESKPPYYIAEMQFLLEVADDRFDEATKVLIELRERELAEAPTIKEVDAEARRSHIAVAAWFSLIGFVVGFAFLGIVMMAAGWDRN